MGNSMEDKHTDIGVYEGMIKKKKKKERKKENRKIIQMRTRTWIDRWMRSIQTDKLNEQNKGL